ncbi:MAG: VCBS repeat-containing protein [Aridibacter famidurans]|nr:VCBS repeat-containing protein [Aridibacter famidurans]
MKENTKSERKGRVDPVSRKLFGSIAVCFGILKNCFVSKDLIARLFSVIAIAALLLPSVSLGFGGSNASAGKTRDPEAQTSPNAKAPPPYRFGNGPSVLEKFSESASKISDAVAELTEPHDLPADFNRPEEYSSFATRLTTLIRRVGMELGLMGPRAREIAANPSVSVPSSVEFDFDGDNVADFARWQPSTGEWKIKNSNGGSYSTDTLGDSNSIIAPGDFNGDGTTDVAIFKAGTWTIHPSGGSSYTFSYGASGDKPVVGDYDGDGTSDVSVFRPSNGTWYIYKSGTGTSTSVSFGVGSDIPVQGDYDGDGKTDVAVWRPVGGVWHILGSTAGYYGYSWGASPDIPVPEDYDGDGKTDYAVWRPDSGTWYVVKSSNLSQTYVASWGNYGDQPAPADYDGDGRAEMTVWRPKTGTWFAYDSCNYDSSCGGGATYFTESLGVAGDTPVAAAYLKKSGSFIQEYNFSQTRLSPKNATGGTNLYSRNFSWGTPLVSLPGRAGLDAGIGVGYNSLVWIKDPSNSTMVFDPDGSNVAPGFNFGFPEIEPVYYDSTTQKYSYLMVTPSGSRIEFRQAAAKNEYESADSSYLILKTLNAEDPNDPVGSFEITVTDTNGTVMTYEWKANAYRLKEIKDRNSNYITVSHDEYGLLEWVKDTLGRTITVNYDSSLYPISITQQWKDNNGAGSAVTRTYATFEYSDITVNPSFTGLAIYGPSNGTVKVLSKIIYGTSGSNLGDTRFFYNSFGQVKKVSNHAADGHELNYTATNLDTPGTGLTDVPRLSQTRTKVENFNLVGGSPQEVVVNNTLTESQNYSFPGSISGSGTLIEVSMVDHPDEFISRTYVGDSGWKEGLPIATEDCVDDDCESSRKRWSWNVWTQDNENLNYFLNPRIEETWVGDDENGNVLRTVLTYEMVDADVSKFGLVNKVQLIDTSASMVLKETETTYNLNSAYTSRRIIGLPSQVLSKGHDGTSLNLVGKLTYGYDEDPFDHEDLEQDISPIEHDTGFGTGFVSGRGNLTSITRWDVTDDTNSSLAVSREIFYDIAGSIVGIVTPDPNSSSGRLTAISYQDNFSDTSPAGTRSLIRPP